MAGPTTRTTPRRPGSPGAAVAVASIGAGCVTAGIQGIAPALPAIQDEFALSAAQVALITSVYLFPSVFSAFAAGVLADRIGLRRVFSGSLLVFGLGALVILVEHSFVTLMTVRFVQGIAFGAVLSLSVGVIGDVYAKGPAAARAQSRRIIAMALGEAVFPVAAGLLLALAWYAPFALQLLALPVAVAAWVLLPGAPARRRGGEARPTARAAFTAPAIVGVQVLGALRFVFKFAVLTYYPLLAVQEVGLSPAVVGVVIGASSALAAVSAALTERLARRWSSSQILAGCLLVIAACLVGMGASGQAVLVVAGMLLFGVQDGVYGVSHNVLVTELAPAGARSAYVGLTGTVRNVGKFVAPLAFGGATVVFTLSQSFLVLGGVSLACVAVARRVWRVQARQRPAAEPG